MSASSLTSDYYAALDPIFRNRKRKPFENISRTEAPPTTIEEIESSGDSTNFEDNLVFDQVEEISNSSKSSNLPQKTQLSAESKVAGDDSLHEEKQSPNNEESTFGILSGQDEVVVVSETFQENNLITDATSNGDLETKPETVPDIPEISANTCKVSKETSISEGKSSISITSEDLTNDEELADAADSEISLPRGLDTDLTRQIIKPSTLRAAWPTTIVYQQQFLAQQGSN